MAKSKRSKSAQVENAGSKAHEAGHEGGATVKNSGSKKMTTEEAQAIVDKYVGVNGVEDSEELKQAKKVLKLKPYSNEKESA